MNAWFLKYAPFSKLLGLIAFLTIPIGCGAVGSPIPPEDVGIEAKVRKQQQENSQSEEALSQDDTVSVEEESVALPPLYPIGTR